MFKNRLSLRKKIALSVLIAGSLFGISPQASQAQTWVPTAAGTTYVWGTAANWSPTTVPNTATAIANINNNIAGAQTINLATGTAANLTVNDLNLGDSDNTHGFTIAAGVAGSTLIFAGTNPSLDVTSGNIANAISAPIQLQANTVFRSNGTAALTLSGVISNNGTVRNMTFNNDVNGTATAAGTNQGQFILSAANTAGGATGTVAISDVRVNSATAGAFGANAANSVTVSNAGQLYLSGATHVNNLVLNSTGWVETAGNFGALRIENAAVSGTITLQQNTTIGVNANNTGTLSGVISGAFGITKVGGTATSGQGELLLSGANTFSGPVTINNGSIRVSNASGLGTNSNVTVNASPTAGGDGNRLAISGTITVGSGKTLTLNSNGTGDFRSMLINTANNNTWAGSIVASGTGLTQVSAATGTTLTVSGGITSTGGGGTGTLFSRGLGTVIYNGVINLGTDRIFSKTDTGTVIVNSTGNTWVRTQVADGQIQIGANNALDNKEFTFGQSGTSNGRLELNGFNQTVAGLKTATGSTGTNHILRNSNLTTASTLTFATPTATTDTATNLQIQGTSTGLGTLHLVSNGLGRTEFNNGLLAANSWTVNSGTVAFTGTTNRLLPGIVTGLAAGTIEKAGTSVLTATSTWNNAGTTNVAGGTLVLGAGTSGAVNVSNAATLTTGQGGGVLNSSAVTFGTTGSTTYAPMLTTTAAVAPLNATSLTTNGAVGDVKVTPMAGSFTTGTYRLLDYTGSIGGNGFSGFALGPVGSYPHITATLDNSTSGQVNLVVSAVDSLIWAGQTNSTWDVNTTSNFALASSTSTGAPFYSGDAVAFNDTHDVGGSGTPVTNSTITGGAVTIGNLTFNNSAVNYSVANPLSGAGGITKTGTGSVTLSGVNSYAGVTAVSNGTLTLSGANLLSGGAVNVTGGTLAIGNSDALRGAGAITVSGGGTFNANGTPVVTRYPAISFSGAGVGGAGAIVNNGAAITNNSHFTNYTMTGDATWGGSGRYDLVAAQTFNGGAFTLTKTGAGELWYNPSAASVLENVIVNGGFFGSQGNNPLSATATVTVNNGGTHQFFGAITGQHKVVLNDGGILRSSSGANTLTGQVTLSGTTAGRNIQAVSGGTLNIAGKITGTGGFTVNDAGTVQLQNATNDYSGDTVVAAGTLNFSATGIIPATTNLVMNGGTFATGNLPRTVASLSGTGGTISGGNTLTTNQTTPTTWSGVLSGTTLAMNGTGSLTLAGATDNASGLAVANSGTLVLAKTGNYTAHSLGGADVVLTVNNGATVQIAGSLTVSVPTGPNIPPADITPATPPANYVDQIYNQGDVLLNTGGTLDLNGRMEAIDGLGGSGTITNTSATAARLYLGYNNNTSATSGFASNFSGAIQDGAGSIELQKIGTGTQTLSGTGNFSGGVTVAAGTLVLDGTYTGNGPIALNGTSVFAGAGTSGGTLTAATGTTVRVGTASAGTAATTLTLGGLTLAGGANINLDFNTAGTTIDKIATTATNGLSISGANNLNVVLSGAGWVPGTYPIMTYAGTVQGTGASNATLVLSTPVGHSTVNVVDDTMGNVNLVVAGAANKWVGNINSTWDTNTTLNWNAVDNLFLTGDTVVFDDTATSFTPNILANQTAAGVTFDNTTAYTLTSTGTVGIAGTGGLIKKNTGTVTISSANTYTGTTDVQAGTLIANYNTGTAQTVIAAASTINVASGATFRAVANDANITLANNLTGAGLVVIDPHFTAGAAVREVVISGNNAGFTGTMRLSPTVLGDGSGSFRTNATLTPAGAGSATIDVDAGGQAWLSAGTFPNNFILSGHGFAETAGGTPAAVSGLTQYTNATIKGGIGAIRMSNGTVISGNVTLDGSAKIGPYTTTGTISGSIFITNPTDILSVGGGGAANTLILTGTNNVGMNALNQIVVNAGGTTGTNVLQVGNLGTTGTLGTGVVTLYNDAAGSRLIIQRSDGYTLAQNVTAVHNGTATNLTRSSFVVNTTGTGVSINGNTIDLTDGTNNIANAGNVHVGGVGGGSGVTGAILNIDGSSIVRTGNFFIGDASGFSGTAIQSGTSNVQVAGRLQVGHYSNNTSAFNISSGTLTIANVNTGTDPSGGSEQNGGIYLGIDGTATMAHSGGTVTTDWIVLDNRGDTPAGTNQPTGIDSYTLSGSGLLVLRSQWGITQRNTTTAVTLAGGTIQNGGTNLQVRMDTAPDISGAVTLDTVSAGNSFNWTRNAAGAGSLALAGGGTLKFTSATTQSVSVPLTGTGALEKLGVGTTTLSSALNTYNGNTTIGAGTLQMGAANALPSGAGKGNVVFSTAGTSSILDLNGFDTSINGLSQPTTSTLNQVVNNATGTNKTLTIGNNDATATFAGVIANNTSGTGTVAVTKVGTGTQTLSGVNTFSGPVNVNGGTLVFSAANNLGDGSATNTIGINGSTLSYTGVSAVSLTANQTVTLGASHGTIDTSSSTGELTLLGGVTSANNNLTKTGPGSLTLAGTSNLGTGTVSVSAGSLFVNSTLTSSTTTVANAATLGGNGTVAGAVTINSGAMLTPASSTTAGTLTLGSLTLNAGSQLAYEFGGTSDLVAVTNAGGLTINGGALSLYATGGVIPLTTNGTYDLFTYVTSFSGSLTNLSIANSQAGKTYSITDTGSIIQLSVATAVSTDWSGTAADGLWTSGGAGGNWNGSAFPSVFGAVANFGNLAATPQTVSLNGAKTVGSIVFDNANSFVIGTNSDVLTLDNGIAAAAMSVTTGSHTINAPIALNGSTNITRDSGTALTLGGNISGAGKSLAFSGAGASTLNGANTYSGGTTLNGGTLNLGNDAALGTGALTIAAGSTINNTKGSLLTNSNNNLQNWDGSFTFTGTNSMDLGTGAVTLGATSTITTTANTLTVGGAIGDGTDTFGITKAGAGTLQLSGVSTYNGATSITDGTLSLTGSLTGGGAISTSGTGILSQSPTGVISGASTVTQGSSATSILAGTNTYTGLTSVTAGVLTISGNNSGASGGLTLTAGQLNLNSDNALGTGRLTLSGGSLDNTDSMAHTQLNNPMQTWSNTANATFIGTQALNLGTGAVTLGTDATAGSFTLTNNSTLPGTSLTVGGNISAVTGGTAGVKTLTIAGPGSTALTGNITRGSASALDITVTSPGTTTLSGSANSIRTINLNGGSSSILELGTGNLTITNAGTNGFRSTTGGTINATGGGSIILGSDLLDNGTADGTTLTVNSRITGPFTFEIYGGTATNTGVTVLTAQNTWTGNVQINGGNLSVSNIGNTGSLTSNLGSGTTIQSGAAVLSGTTVNTGKLIYTGPGETTNRILSMNGAGFAIEQAATSGNLLFTANVAVPNTGAKTLFLLGSTAGTGEISGVIPNNTAATSIQKLGTGTWTLSGANTYTGTTTVSQGTLILSGRGTGTPGIVTVSNLPGLSATLNITSGTYNFGAGRMNVGNASTTAATGTVNQSGGDIIFTGSDQLLVGQNTVGNTGIYNLSGGSITTAAAAGRGIMLGVNSNPTPGPTSGGGTFNLSGTGTINMTAASGGGGNAILQIGRSDTVANNTTNLFNQTGGTANVGILAMGGAAAGSTGVNSTLTITGGTFSANSFTLLARGDSNTATINIGGTGQVTLPAFPTARGAGSTATITFDSTTGFLSPLVASATYMPAGTFNNAYLTANGAKFNVGTGNDITIGQVLENAVSPAAVGTLTKSGLGTLVLSSANTYTGLTTVSAGTLNITGSINATNGATIATGATLQLSPATNALNSTTNIVNSGTLSVTGTAQSVGNISSTGSTTVSGAGTSATPTLIANDIDQTSLTINNGAYVRLAASGTSTSALTSLTMGTTANLDISDNDVVINAPSPAAGASTLSAVAAAVNSGFAGGNGIVTNTFTTNLETVGFGLNDFLGFTSFGGVTVNTDSVLIKYTYFGDSNLDGFVTDDDLGYFLAGYGTDVSANPWAFGDYNHDGFTTDDDLGFFLAAYGSTPGLAGGSIQAIPEPSTLVLGTLAGLGLGALSLRRRRAKSE